MSLIDEKGARKSLERFMFVCFQEIDPPRLSRYRRMVEAQDPLKVGWAG